MPLTNDTLNEIRTQVCANFETAERIFEIFSEEMYEPGELDPDELRTAISSAIMECEASKGNWPAITDCDRLDACFVALNRQGIIALHNAGYTQSDGYDDFICALDRHPNRASIKGYCFYHGQDTERAVKGGGLCLAFGPVESASEETHGPVIGDLIVSELKKSGLVPDWDGSFRQRITIPNFQWKKRR